MDTISVIIGTGGMGQAVARRIGPGTRLLLADYDDQALQAVASSLRGDGFEVTARRVDVASRESIEELASSAFELGPITAVVHTAGLSPAQAPADAILRVDLVGVTLSLDAFGAVIASGGAGVYIASMAGTMALGHLPSALERQLATASVDELLEHPALQASAFENAGTAYAIAKRANQLRVQHASIAWGSRGARVNSISPGVISTPMGQHELAGESGAQMRGLIEASSTGRVGTPNDIANAAAFLLGTDASFISGADLLVDGGAVAGSLSGKTS